jgi:hypothetical protein
VHTLALNPPRRAIQHVVAEFAETTWYSSTGRQTRGFVSPGTGSELGSAAAFRRTALESATRLPLFIRHFGSRQRIVHAVNDKLGIEPYGGPG